MNPAILFMQKWERDLDAQRSIRRKKFRGIDRDPDVTEDRKRMKSGKCSRTRRSAPSC